MPPRKLFERSETLPLLGATQSRLAQRSLPLVSHKTGNFNVEYSSPSRTRTHGVSIPLVATPLVFAVDLFHTLVNCNARLFYGLFVFVYLLFYALFGALYFGQSECINGLAGGGASERAMKAYFFSVFTAQTLGYTAVYPNQDCVAVNSIILTQLLTVMLLNYSVLGIFFVRLSRPSDRARTIVFSRAMTIHTDDAGVMRLSFRVANLRKRQIIQPTVRMLVSLEIRRQRLRPSYHQPPEGAAALAGPSISRIEEGGSMRGDGGDEGVDPGFANVALEGERGGMLSIFLALPTTVCHVITPSSPFYDTDHGDLASRDLEVLVLLDGIDSSTGAVFQAAHSYLADDLRWHQRFRRCVKRCGATGRRVVNLERFDQLTDDGPGAPSRASLRPGAPVATAPATPQEFHEFGTG